MMAALGREKPGDQGEMGERLTDTGLGQQPAGDSAKRGARAAGLAVLLLGLVGIGVLTAMVAKAYPVSSDDGSGVREASSVLRCNLLL